MKRTDRHIDDKECRELLTAIIKMVISAYSNPLRKGFEKSSRMTQCGYDLISILRSNDVVMPGEPNEQQKLELEDKNARE